MLRAGLGLLIVFFMMFCRRLRFLGTRRKHRASLVCHSQTVAQRSFLLTFSRRIDSIALSFLLIFPNRNLSTFFPPSLPNLRLPYFRSF